MPSTGPSPFAAGVDDATAGMVAWTNPNNAIASDATFATVHMGDAQTSHYLQVHNATSLSFPAGAKVVGIVVDIDRKANFNSTIVGASRYINDLSITLVQSGTHSSDRSTSALWPTATTRATFGSPTDTWGLTWTTSQFATNNFGVDFQAACTDDIGSGVTASVDYVQVTVYYTVGGKLPTAQVFYIGI